MLHRIKEILPDEWRSAWGCYRDMWAVAVSTSHGAKKVILGNLVLLIPGLALGFILEPLESGTTDAIISTAGILAGFVMALLLFSGALPDPSGVTLPVLKSYGLKVRYLIFSQCVTFFAFILVLIAAVGHQIVPEASNWRVLSSALVIGASSWALARTLVLPAQTYEVHHFALQAVETAKQKEVSEQIAQKRRGLQEELDESESVTR